MDTEIKITKKIMSHRKFIFFSLSGVGFIIFLLLLSFGHSMPMFAGWSILALPIFLLVFLILGFTFLVLGFKKKNEAEEFNQTIPSKFKPRYLIGIVIGIIVLYFARSLLLNIGLNILVLPGVSLVLLVLGITFYVLSKYKPWYLIVIGILLYFSSRSWGAISLTGMTGYIWGAVVMASAIALTISGIVLSLIEVFSRIFKK